MNRLRILLEFFFFLDKYIHGQSYPLGTFAVEKR